MIAIFLITLATFILYVPLLINPTLYLGRNNDLTDFFWPIYYFVKDQVINNHSLPLWNNVFLSGTPLLPDPQSPLFYPPNIIFLILPINASFLASSIIHTLLGGIGFFLFAKALKIDLRASILAAVFYCISPQIAGFLQAGHFGLVESFAWLPFALLATFNLSIKPQFKWSVLLSVSMAGLYYTHTTTFVWVGITVGLMILILKAVYHQKNRLKSLAYFFVSTILTLGLTAIVLLPQLFWSSQTSRTILKTNPQVHPIWLSYDEYFSTIFTPWKNGIEPLRNTQTEKWIPLGLFPTLLAVVGFVKLKLKTKVLIFGIFILGIIWSLNNRSPIDFILMEIKWFTLSRISTRIWFVITTLVYLLAGYGFQTLYSHKKIKVIAVVIGFIAFTELLEISYLKITKPVKTSGKAINSRIYEFFAKDKTLFRVTCLNRCISQKDAATHKIELVDGYSTLIQNNYFNVSQKMYGSSWNYYTLSIPPIGTYIYEKLQPDPTILGEFNVKYVISPHLLSNRNFKFIEQYDHYFLYENLLTKPRAQAPIINYSPNKIRLDVSKATTDKIALSEVYNPDWKAYLDGQEEVLIEESPEALRLITIKKDTKFVDLVYKPKGFLLGKIITATTIFLLGFGLYVKNTKRK